MAKTDYNSSDHAFTAKRLFLGLILCWTVSLLSMGCIGVYMYKLQSDDARRDRVFDFANAESNDPFIKSSSKESSEDIQFGGGYLLAYMIRSFIALYLFYCLSLWRKIARLKRYGLPVLIGAVTYVVLDIYYFPLEAGATFSTFLINIGLYLYVTLILVLQCLVIDFILRRFVFR